MLHGGCRRVSKALSMAMEPVSKPTVDGLAEKISSRVKAISETKYRRCMAVDGTKLRVEKACVHAWSAVDVGLKSCWLRRHPTAGAV